MKPNHPPPPPLMDSGALPVATSERIPWRGPLKRVRTLQSDHEGWLMLDSFLRPMRYDDSFCANSKKTVTTSNGDSISVALRAVAPPQISRLYFEWLPKPKSVKDSRDDELSDDSQDLAFYHECEEEGGTSKHIPISSDFPPELDPKVIAAHRNNILLRVIVPDPFSHIREEFFIYQAHTGTIASLAPCGHGFINDDGSSNMGILCRDSGQELAVAHLTVSAGNEDSSSSHQDPLPVTAELCINLNGGKWCTKLLPITHSVSEGPELYWWVTDTVVSFGDFICWVDYLRGILFCDVFSPNREVQYVPLPVCPYDGYEHPELSCRGALYPYRSVSVTKEGLKFVDVASSQLWFSGRGSTGNAITCWTLGSDRVTWFRDGTLEIDHFFALAKAMHLPCMQPEFPLVDMEYPNVIYFVMGNEPCCSAKTCSDGKKFLIAVNMLSKTIDMYSRYTVISSFSGVHGDKDDDKTSYNLFSNDPFVPVEVSK